MELRRNSKNLTKSVSQYFRSIDPVLFATTVAICLFSIVNISGIVGADNPLLKKQIILVAIGLAAMVGFSFFNYRYLKNYSVPVLLFYVIALLLLGVAFFSRTIRGVNAWIAFGGFTFEPSELMKLSLIVLLAKYFSQRHIHINQFRHIAVSGLYFGIPALMILAQPDLGSAAIVSLIWFGLLMAAGINRRHLFLLITVAVVGMYMSWIFALKPYQKERIVSFINPHQDPTGIGYNIIQSQIAIGSGGWTGDGPGKGSQATLGFLPEAHNDFVVAAMAEQFGFAGVAAVFALLAGIMLRILQIGERADNNFAKLFSVGLAILIFAHVVISASVNIGLMPITGLPFSFLSYGGSHLLVLMIGLGTMQSIHRYS